MRDQQGGQSTVEFALVLPLVFLVLLGLMQVGIVVHSHIGVTHTAREVARVLAVDPTADAHAAAVAAGSLNPGGLSVEVTFEASASAGRQLVVVQVDYSVPTVSRVLGVAGDIVVSATAAMLVEG